MNKKAKCFLLLVCCLCLSLVIQAQAPMSVSAASNVRITKTVKAKYLEGVAEGKVVTASAVYDDNYFYLTEQSSYKKGKYLQGGLAKLSMLASATAYHKEYAVKFLKNCKFTAVEYHAATITSGDNDHVSYVTGVRKLGDDMIVAVVIKGTGGNYEWVSNFNLGTGEIHSGFSLAAKEVAQELDGILDKNKVKGTVRFWITGHSRGAAVGNLLAKELTDKYGKDQVYAYTFATPRVAIGAKSKGYENIFNYVNTGDFITELAPADWGYARYGNDIVLAANKKKEMKKLFKKALGKDPNGNAYVYAGYTKEEKNALLAMFLEYGGASSEDYYKPRANGTAPAALFQNGIAYLLAGDDVNGTINVLMSVFGDPQAQAIVGKLGMDGGMDMGFAHAHSTSTYLCWVEAMY